MSPVVRSMTSTCARLTALLGAALLAAGCAAQAVGAGGPTAAPSPVDGRVDPPGDGLVLQVASTGGFVDLRSASTRLPLVSVYADGRVITQGPVAAIHPGPALPNLQVSQVDRSRVEELVRRALAAGIGRGVDYGMPPVADVPDTRLTVVTPDGPRTSDVYALQPGLLPDDDDVPGLTEDQRAAREELQGLLDDLSALGAEAGRAYEPEAIAAVAGTDIPAGARPEDVATWPGPPLPGEELRTGSRLSCVVARDEAVDAVLEVAADATETTVWTDPGGGRWAVTLRPLLPHESGCADLPID